MATRRSTGGCWPAELACQATRRRVMPPTRTTQRPRAEPATMPSSAPSSSSSATSVAREPRSRGRRSVASRSQSSRRRAIGTVTESIPSSATPRRMNGKTVVWRVAPPALPDAATAAPRRSVRSTYGSVAAPDRVHRPGPAFRVERPSLGGHLVPGQDPGCAKRPQALRLVGLAGDRPDLIAAVRQDRQRRAAHPARGAGHEDGPGVRLEATVLERDHGHRRGEPGRPDRHRVARRQPRRQRNDPVGRHSLVLAVAAVPGHAEVVAVRQHLVADGDVDRGAGDHDPGQVDPRDQRADPRHLAVRPRREAVLEVDAGPGRPGPRPRRAAAPRPGTRARRGSPDRRPSRRRTRGIRLGIAVTGPS